MLSRDFCACGQTITSQLVHLGEKLTTTEPGGGSNLQQTREGLAAMADTHHEPEPKNFAPKNPPKLNPPREDLISVEDLAKCNGM